MPISIQVMNLKLKVVVICFYSYRKLEETVKHVVRVSRV